VSTLRTPRVVAARKLLRRREREAAGRFLVEGPHLVREATRIHDLFGTPSALARHPDLARRADRVSPVGEEVLAVLAGTVAPQGLVGVCDFVDVPLDVALDNRPSLVAVLVGIRDPGNAGTVLRTADAAGAGTVIFAGEAVDPYNGKCVRASAGSLFHVDMVRSATPEVDELRAAGMRVLAADGHGDADLFELDLAAPTAWLFGSEAHGLPDGVAEVADARVRIPIHGRAESLNLAAAAAVCLYASATAMRRGDPQR
jgi:TrmH family RNA methyltransferase